MQIDHKNIESLNEKEVIEMISGTLRSIIDNTDYFYHSPVGVQYSKLHPQGTGFNQDHVCAFTFNGHCPR
jgi:hypothetical protein